MPRNRTDWEEAIAEYEASDESHAGFCASRGLAIGNFRSWLYKLRREQRSSPRKAGLAPKFFPVSIATTARSAAQIEVEWVREGIIVRLDAPGDADAVARLVRALRTP